MIRIIFSLLFVCLFVNASATIERDTTKHKLKHDSLFRKGVFELSFGQSLLFISNSKQINIRNQAAIVIPTSAMLFFVEFRPLKRVRVPVFFNLPTESKQFL